MKHILTLAALVLATCCLGQVPQGIPTNDLISWYGFDGNTDDAHAFQAHYDAFSPEYVTDRFGLFDRSIRFDGVEDQMIAPDLGQYSDLTQLTVSMWVKFAGYPDYVSGEGGHALFMKSQPVGANAVISFNIFTEYDENALRFDTRFANGTQINLRFEPFSESLETETWHHLVCRFDGTKNQLFWEGVLVAESDTYPQMSILNTSYDIMTSTAFGNIDRWQGSLDDLGTWSRALSMAEIQALYSWAPPSGCMNPEACNFKPDAVIDDGTCASCEALATACGEGTIWDALTNTCVVANVSDTDFDGCVGINDFLIHLSNFGSGCGLEPEWSCGDPLEYQGYDYQTVLIGEQCWFAENLRSENYEDGDVIPAGLSDEEWSSTTSGAMAVYGEGSSSCNTDSPDGDACDYNWSLAEYGRLYNWHAVNDTRGLCPSGWHVSTDDEWTVMTDELGGLAVAGGEIKATFGWHDGGNGTNSSGFAGLPGGYRSDDGDFSSAGIDVSWWSPSLSNTSDEYKWFRDLDSSNGGVYRNATNPRHGFSVRCIKDSE